MTENGLEGLASLGELNAGFEVVQEGGRWYLSPTATITEPLVAVLASLEQDDIRNLVDTVESGFSVELDD